MTIRNLNELYFDGVAIEAENTLELRNIKLTVDLNKLQNNTISGELICNGKKYYIENEDIKEGVDISYIFKIYEDTKLEDIPKIISSNMRKDMENIKSAKSLRFIENQTPEICLAAVRRVGNVLNFVKNQTPEICLAAVKQNGWALEYVKEQTPEICWVAIVQDSWALQYIKDQTLEMCLTAVRKDGDALKHVKNQTPEICLTAIKCDGWALEYVKEQTLELCLAAVKESSGALRYISQEFKEICEEYISNK